MSETKLGNLTAVSPFSDYLTSSISLAPFTPHGNKNLIKILLQMMERNIFSLGKTLNIFIETKELKGNRQRIKVGIQQVEHQLGAGTKALINQGHPIDNIMIVVSALNPQNLLLHLIFKLMVAVKVTFFVKTYQG